MLEGSWEFGFNNLLEVLRGCQRLSAEGCAVLVQPEQELGSHWASSLRFVGLVVWREELWHVLAGLQPSVKQQG